VGWPINTAPDNWLQLNQSQRVIARIGDLTGSSLPHPRNHEVIILLTEIILLFILLTIRKYERQLINNSRVATGLGLLRRTVVVLLRRVLVQLESQQATVV
jgi:hypothetical protein